MSNIEPKAAEAITLLETVRARIGMYVHPVEISTVQGLLTGFELAMNLSGVRWEESAASSVLKSRGIEESPTGPVPQLQERGLTAVQIIDELFEIEIQTIRESNRIE